MRNPVYQQLQISRVPDGRRCIIRSHVTQATINITWKESRFKTTKAGNTIIREICFSVPQHNANDLPTEESFGSEPYKTLQKHLLNVTLNFIWMLTHLTLKLCTCHYVNLILASLFGNESAHY